MPMLDGHAAWTSMLLVHAACPWLFFACSCCMSMLHVYDAGPRCKLASYVKISYQNLLRDIQKARIATLCLLVKRVKSESTTEFFSLISRNYSHAIFNEHLTLYRFITFIFYWR
jgi:hypothetical protein